MIQKTTELTEPPIVGKFYLVPCVVKPRAQHRFGREFTPVIGEPHTDVELGVSAVHLHIDARFLTEREMNNGRGPEYSLAYILPVIAYKYTEPMFQRLKCRREMPAFPAMLHHRWAPFHEKYLGAKVKCGRCPHRNFDLTALPKNTEGHVACNGHGLQIDMNAGVVVERTIGGRVKV